MTLRKLGQRSGSPIVHHRTEAAIAACGAYTPEIGDASVDANAASLADHAETAFGTRPVGDTKRRPDRP